MDHPLKADVATTRRALSKQHDPPGPTTAQTEADASTNTRNAAHSPYGTDRARRPHTYTH